MISEQMLAALLEGVPDVLVGAGRTLEDETQWVKDQIATCLNECRATADDCAEYCRQHVLGVLSDGKAALQGGLWALQPEVGSTVRELYADVEGILSSAREAFGDDIAPLITPHGRDPEPPPTGGECGTNPNQEPRCPSLEGSGFGLFRWDQASGRWVGRTDIRFPDRPSEFFTRDVMQYRWSPGIGVQTATIPPDRWPSRIALLIVNCVDDRGVCTYQFGGQFGSQIVPPVPISGLIQPPIAIPPVGPPPPPPPPIPPPPPPPGVPPPPVDVGCPPADPCYPAPTQLVSDNIYTATPLPSRYWVQVRCIDHCSAQIRCYYGDCPPDCPPGWTCYGTYDHCPNQIEIEWLIRHCLPGPPPPPPPGLPPPISGGGPTPVRPPGVVPPPEPPEEPPEECVVFDSHPPRWDAVTPNCVDERAYFGPIFDRSMAFADVREATERMAEEYDDSVEPEPVWLLEQSEPPL